MRLTTIVLVAAASIFACCEGTSAVSSSESLAFPQSDVQTENNGNRFLRVHHDTEEERAGPQLTKSLSEKFVPKTAALTRSKSLSELSKMDDAAYLEAIRGQHGGIFQLIENKGFNPDGMLIGRHRPYTPETLHEILDGEISYLD